jgi:hypothetical protein
MHIKDPRAPPSEKRINSVIALTWWRGREHSIYIDLKGWWRRAFSNRAQWY